MPAYPVSLLSDAALAEIYAYLMSIPAPPSASEIALLKD
jgi:mono/diheme cytochrome c family protein